MIISFRKAGLVKRYHTEPTIQTQTIAEHTYHVLRIWFELYGPPSPEETAAILVHDLGEKATGDLPHMIKRDYPELKNTLGQIEDDYIRNVMMSIYKDHPYDIELTKPVLLDLDGLKIKICDLLEMAEFSLDEFKLGNRNALSIMNNVEKALEKIFNDPMFEKGKLQEVLRPAAKRFANILSELENHMRAYLSD